MSGPSVIVPDFVASAVADDVARAYPNASVVGIAANGKLERPAPGAVALFTYFPNDRYAKAFKGERIDTLLDEYPTLRLIQSHSVGIDGLLTRRLIESPAELCNAAPLHTRPMAETALALMLAAAKRIPFHVRNQVRHVWQRTPKTELRGSTLTIVGLGRIGADLATLCAALGMRVVGVRRSTHLPVPPGVDRVVGPDELDAALADADFVVLALPLVPATTRLIGRRQLEAMKPTACLINVSRGAVVDEGALVERLTAGALAFACLDTFAVEPLPSDHPLWDLPNVLVTPHNSASSQHMEARVIALFLDNLGRLARAEPLLNRIDKSHPT